MSKRLVTLVAVVVAFTVAACGGTPDTDTDGLNVALEVGPADTQSLIVVITGDDSRALTDATVTLEGNMNHAGMVPVFSEPVRDDADGAADGRYTVPFEFTMLGDWIIGVDIVQADGTELRTHIDVNVAESGVTVK